VKGKLAALSFAVLGCVAVAARPQPIAMADPRDEMTVREMVASAHEFEDCDDNGIPDSIDIRVGACDDVNHNGVIDQCDGDTSLFGHYHNTSWRRFAATRDTAYFWSAYDVAPDRSAEVMIRFTVPPGKHAVSLAVFEVSGPEVRQLVKDRLVSGGYESTWVLNNSDGRVVAPGRYDLRLKIDERQYSRPVQWRIQSRP